MTSSRARTTGVGRPSRGPSTATGGSKASDPTNEELLAAFDRLSPRAACGGASTMPCAASSDPDSTAPPAPQPPGPGFPTTCGNGDGRPGSGSGSWATWPGYWPTSWPPTPGRRPTPAGGGQRRSVRGHLGRASVSGGPGGAARGGASTRWAWRPPSGRCRPPDPSDWLDALGTWVGPRTPGAAVVVGESGDGALVDALGAGRPAGGGGRAAGRVGVAVDGVTAAGLGEPGAGHRVRRGRCRHLTTAPDRQRRRRGPGRLRRPARPGRQGRPARPIASGSSQPGGTVVVLATDQSAWDEALPIPARDLLPGPTPAPRDVVAGCSAGPVPSTPVTGTGPAMPGTGATRWWPGWTGDR